MGDGLPGPTPEGHLIRRVRGLTIPKLSIRNAAARIGMSAEQWGYVERGYLPSRGGKSPQPFSPPAATLARMAYALEITPERLESEGQRPDAAEVLREMERQAPASSSFRPAPLSDDEGDVAKLLEASRRLGIPVQDRFESIMHDFRKVRDVFPPDEWPPGVLLFKDPRYAEMWDAKAGRTYGDDQPYTPSRLAFTVAMQMVRDEAESRNAATDSAAC